MFVLQCNENSMPSPRHQDIMKIEHPGKYVIEFVKLPRFRGQQRSVVLKRTKILIAMQ